MRISTSTMHDAAVRTMQNAQARLARTQTQMATGLRVQTPADDPAAAVHIIELQRQLAASDQLAVNSTAAQNRLEASEQGLADTTNLLQRVKELTLQANSATIDASDRASIATEIRARTDELMQIANRQDPSGDYLYAGLSATTTPFARVGGSVSYFGDTGSRGVQVAASQRVIDGHSGYDVFQRIPAGNGKFTTAAASSNTGSGMVDAGAVTNPAAWVADNYSIVFTAPGAYEVRNGGGTVVSTAAYTSGNAIQFNGATVTISGSPATGDTFAIAAGGSRDLFATLDTLATTLGSGTVTQAQRAQFTTTIGGVLAQLDQGLNHVLSLRAEVGSRLAAIDTAATTRADAKLTLETAMSNLKDIDYAEVVSRMNQQLAGLQAAQQAYAKVSQLSLFDYL